METLKKKNTGDEKKKRRPILRGKRSYFGHGLHVEKAELHTHTRDKKWEGKTEEETFFFFFFFLSFLLGVDRPPASTSSIHYLSPFFLSLRDSIVEVVFSFLPSTVYPVLFENVLEAKVLREKKLPYFIF